MATVGRAEVKIVADARGFSRDAEREINRELRKVDVDTNPIRNGIVQGLTSSATRGAVAVTVERFANRTGRNFIENLGIVLQGGISAKAAGAIGAGFLAALGPIMVTVGTLLAGTLITALGAGLAGLGLFFAAQTPRIKREFEGLFRELSTSMFAISQPFVQTLETVMEQIARVFAPFRIVLKEAFEDLAPALSDFTVHVADAFIALLPAIQPVTDAFIVILEQLGPRLPEIFGGLADAIINVADSVGDGEAFVDLIEWLFGIVEGFLNFLAVLTDIGNWFSDHPELMNAFTEAIAGLAEPLGVIIGHFADLFTWLVENEAIMNAFALVLAGLVAPIRGAIQFLADLITWVRGLGDNVAAVGETVGRWIGNIRNFFSDLAERVGRTVRGMGTGIRNAFRDFREGAIEQLQRLGRNLRNIWNGIVDFVRELPGRIGRAASGMWDSIKNGFRNAVNTIIDGWNSLSFSVPGVDLGPLGTFGGFTIGTPNIPRLQRGGLIQRAGIAEVGEAGRETVFLPAGAVVAPGSVDQVMPQAEGGIREITIPIVIGDEVVRVIRATVNGVLVEITEEARAA